MCGFQTKGYTAFPDNNEIFRVRSVLVTTSVVAILIQFDLQQVLVLRSPTSKDELVGGPQTNTLTKLCDFFSFQIEI